MAIWIQLPQLPIQYYDASILFKIGSMIGKPIKIDVHTGNASRGHYARICLEVNCGFPLLSTIKIGNHIQQVQYEISVPFCSACGCLNHLNCSKETCKTDSTMESSDGRHSHNSAENSPKPEVSKDKPAVSTQSEELPEAKWQVVARKGNRKRLDNTIVSSSNSGKTFFEPPLNFQKYK
ncbi:hypothetical protein COLO4_13283 [Corchorus olitorius]|uniref:Uncharacterized protein n=1 Tax=Corchorus olitorius TaxID=93759 RepID=A0A1R3JXA6_9ROSI|nr:hypothetical protein COLO4_13283 [Corchorus olitorius]